jgi:hypothetical protein
MTPASAVLMAQPTPVVLASDSAFDEIIKVCFREGADLYMLIPC